MNKPSCPTGQLGEFTGIFKRTQQKSAGVWEKCVAEGSWNSCCPHIQTDL